MSWVPGTRRQGRYYDQLACKYPSFSPSRATTATSHRSQNTPVRGTVVCAGRDTKKDEKVSVHKKTSVIEAPLILKRQIFVPPLITRHMESPTKPKVNTSFKDFVLPDLVKDNHESSVQPEPARIVPSDSSVSLFSEASSLTKTSSQSSIGRSFSEEDDCGDWSVEPIFVMDDEGMPVIPELDLNFVAEKKTMSSPPPSLSPFTFAEEVVQLNDAEFEQFLEEDTLWLKSALFGSRWNSDNLYDFIVSLDEDQYSTAVQVFLRQYFKIARLSHILHSLTTMDSLPSIAQIIEKGIEELFRVRTCMVWIHIPSAGMMVNHSRLMKYPVGSGIVGTCAAENREVIAPNPKSSALFSDEYDYPFCEDADLVVCTPASDPKTGRVYAVIMCIDKVHLNGATFMYFPQSELVSLHYLTERLYRVFRRLKHETERVAKVFHVFGRCLRRLHSLIRLITKVGSIVSSLLKCESVSVFLKKKDRFMTIQTRHDGTKMVFVKPEKLGVASRVFKTGVLANIAIPHMDPDFDNVIDGAHGTRGVLAVPMAVNEHIIGVIVARGKKQHPCFASPDEAFLELIATAVAPAVKLSLAHKKQLAKLNGALSVQDRLASLLEMAESLSQETDNGVLTRRIIHKAKEIVQADRASLFLIDETRTHLVSKFADGTNSLVLRIDTGIAGAVATSGEVLNLADVYEDPRFNPAVDKDTGYRTKSMIAIPVRDQCNQIVAVVQLINKLNGEPFSDSDVELSRAMCVFAGIALANSSMIESALATKRKIEVLLDMVILMSQNDSMTSVLDTIMSSTRSLIQADRSAVFLVDKKNATVTSAVVSGETNPIVVKLGQGIVGFVAETGQTANIADAYQDNRFNSSVDKVTGYRTRSILCVPVKNSQGEVLCAIEYINKDLSVSGGVFSDEDELLVRAFTTFVGLAIERNRDRSRSVHSAHVFTQSLGESFEIPKRMLLNSNVIDKLDLATSSILDIDTVIFSIFHAMGFSSRYRICNKRLAQFVYELRENYPHQYAWSRIVKATHFAYYIIHNTEIQDILQEDEKFAVILATLCSHLEAQFVNEQDSVDIGFEVLFHNHHPGKIPACEKAVEIITNDDVGLFEHIPEADGRELWSFVFDLIISTDANVHFEILDKFTGLVYPQNIFHRGNKHHRQLLMQIIVKCSSVSYSTRSFQEILEQSRHVASLNHKETIGDENIAKEQLGFMLFVARPMIAMLGVLIPSQQTLLINIESNINRLKHLAS